MTLRYSLTSQGQRFSDNYPGFHSSKEFEKMMAEHGGFHIGQGFWVALDKTSPGHPIWLFEVHFGPETSAAPRSESNERGWVTKVFSIPLDTFISIIAAFSKSDYQTVKALFIDEPMQSPLPLVKEEEKRWNEKTDSEKMNEIFPLEDNALEVPADSGQGFKEASAAAYLSPEVCFDKATSDAFIAGYLCGHETAHSKLNKLDAEFSETETRLTSENNSLREAREQLGAEISYWAERYEREKEQRSELEKERDEYREVLEFLQESFNRHGHGNDAAVILELLAKYTKP